MFSKKFGLQWQCLLPCLERWIRWGHKSSKTDSQFIRFWEGHYFSSCGFFQTKLKQWLVMPWHRRLLTTLESNMTFLSCFSFSQMLPRSREIIIHDMTEETFEVDRTHCLKVKYWQILQLHLPCCAALETIAKWYWRGWKLIWAQKGRT